MTLKKAAKCGTLESNDIFLMLTPSEDGIEIELERIFHKISVIGLLKNNLENISKKL